MYKYGELPDKLNLQDIINQVKDCEYEYNGTLTICILTMRNGFKVVGTSACVSPDMYSQATGEQIAYRNAIDKAWDYEGYLLASKRREYLDNIKIHEYHQPPQSA